jgi:hypothetical protein
MELAAMLWRTPMQYKQILSALVCATTASILAASAQESAAPPGSGEPGPSSQPLNPVPSQSNPAASVDASGQPQILPGAFEQERGALLQKILRAKQQGCGVSSYMAEFGRIQDAVASGQPEAPIQQRIGSLSKALDDQLERSKVLKVQRIPPSQSSFASPGGPMSGPGGGNGPNIDQLMKQYGNRIPKDFNRQALMKEIGNDAGNKNFNPSDLINKFKDDPRAQELLKQLKPN